MSKTELNLRDLFSVKHTNTHKLEIWICQTISIYLLFHQTLFDHNFALYFVNKADYTYSIKYSNAI